LDAQLTAVNYLSAFPQYQDRIRVTYFTNPEAPAEARAQAAESLGTYDPQFARYALVVTQEADVDPKLFEAAISGYVNAQLKSGTLDRGSAQIISDQVKSYLQTHQTEVDEALSKRILDLGERLESISIE
jgi:hypothetical protein